MAENLSQFVARYLTLPVTENIDYGLPQQGVCPRECKKMKESRSITYILRVSLTFLALTKVVTAMAGAGVTDLRSSHKLWHHVHSSRARCARDRYTREEQK